MTIPTGAETSSAGVKATWTRMDAGTLTARGRHAVLLPAPRSRDRPQLLGVRPPDLRRLHEHRAGRHPLSRPCRDGPPVEPDREGRPPEPFEWHARDEGAHRVQRRLLPHHGRAGRGRRTSPEDGCSASSRSSGRSSRTGTGGGSSPPRSSTRACSTSPSTCSRCGGSVGPSRKRWARGATSRSTSSRG